MGQMKIYLKTRKIRFFNVKTQKKNRTLQIFSYMSQKTVLKAFVAFKKIRKHGHNKAGRRRHNMITGSDEESYNLYWSAARKPN